MPVCVAVKHAPENDVTHGPIAVDKVFAFFVYPHVLKQLVSRCPRDVDSTTSTKPPV
jgi:hypothetical protein